MNEPESGQLSTVIQSLKQSVARMLGVEGAHFWLRRYYDFNVWGERKRIEKLRYMHRNPGSPSRAAFARDGVEAGKARARRTA